MNKKNKVTYSREKYLSYLISVDWLIKKSKLVNTYLKRGWSISCENCKDTNNLQVHHLTYINLYKEKINDLSFLCAICHKRSYTHKKEFKEENTKKFFEIIESKEFINNLDKNYGKK